MCILFVYLYTSVYVYIKIRKIKKHLGKKKTLFSEHLQEFPIVSSNPCCLAKLRKNTFLTVLIPPPNLLALEDKGLFGWEPPDRLPPRQPNAPQAGRIERLGVHLGSRQLSP